ncbi:uncharacterized protein F5891DRAFT_539252 [Suillus fuscotomentosus]|uniref:Uncharacterized protein n=1 Tax=Suillus fuscotomentosus TaxID=1912939 RepID=A0AAD4HHV8_9AGAM|nr:uncharacterized protein F5891DRAFT_539252 [Suillus fuscotomentosus]KAG1897193.1 hypothetical protein F5891DRAFT_539252 [Suillus fuscotomentosus]
MDGWLSSLNWVATSQLARQSLAAPVVPGSFQIHRSQMANQIHHDLVETNGYRSAHSDGKEPPPTRRRRLLLAYLAAVLFCIIKDAPLISNPNRATRSSRYRSFRSSFCSQQKTQVCPHC